jgi:hypothetical protein
MVWRGTQAGWNWKVGSSEIPITDFIQYNLLKLKTL